MRATSVAAGGSQFSSTAAAYADAGKKLNPALTPGAPMYKATFYAILPVDVGVHGC